MVGVSAETRPPHPMPLQERSRVVQLGYEGHLSLHEYITECMVFLVVTPCSFGGTYRLDLQGRILSEARNQQKQSTCSAVSRVAHPALVCQRGVNPEPGRTRYDGRHSRNM
jgi:hypothetical protein